MKRNFFLLALTLLAPVLVSAQSSTTEALQKNHSGSLSLFFYNNTLRMINQNEDREFDDLIKDIEKMRFLMLKKNETAFGDMDYKKLVSDYESEDFEAAMTSRHEGKNFDIFVKEKNGTTKGMLVLINDQNNLYVLDILGRIALDKVTKLYGVLDGSTDIGSKIKAFTSGNVRDKKSEENH